MKGRRHASPGEAVGNVYFFGFVLFFFFGIFQVFYAKKPHISFTIRKTRLYRKEKTQLRDK